MSCAVTINTGYAFSNNEKAQVLGHFLLPKTWINYNISEIQIPHL